MRKLPVPGADLGPTSPVPRFERVSQTLLQGLNLTAVGDQSVFVTSAVSSVIREVVIAAALNRMMIMLFLGSWRARH